MMMGPRQIAGARNTQSLHRGDEAQQLGLLLGRDRPFVLGNPLGGAHNVIRAA